MANMAKASGLWTQEQFSCPICLDLLKDPVTIPCGHSFCMDCITDCWDREDDTGCYSCPQCRHPFDPRPVLGRSIMLAEVMEKLKIMVVPAASPAHYYAGPGDVGCHVCVGRKLKAIKSCLVCLSSYCESHLRAHDDLNPGKKHKLIDAVGKIEDLICSQHNKLLEVLCRTDQKCICLLCAMDEHKNHDTVPASADRNVKKTLLVKTQKTFRHMVQEKEKEFLNLRKVVQSLKMSAQTAVEDSERVFTEMIHSIERRRSEVTKLIRDQERAEVSRAEELMEKLEQEIAELKKRDAELEKLSHTDDHIHFIKTLPSHCVYTGSAISGAAPVPKTSFHEIMKNNLSKIKRLEDILQTELTMLFKQDSPQLTLDSNLMASTGNTETMTPKQTLYSTTTTLLPLVTYEAQYATQGHNPADPQQQAGKRPPFVCSQGTEPLRASLLAAISPEEREQMIGQRLYPLIQAMQPQLAGKITGMLLELENSELLYLLEDARALSLKVDEAILVLQAHRLTKTVLNKK